MLVAAVAAVPACGDVKVTALLTAAAPGATAAPPLDFVATSEFPDDPGPGVSSLFDADVQPAREAPGVYARGVHTAAAAEKQLSRLAGPPRWGFELVRLPEDHGS